MNRSGRYIHTFVCHLLVNPIIVHLVALHGEFRLIAATSPDENSLPRAGGQAQLTTSSHLRSPSCDIQPVNIYFQGHNLLRPN